MISSIETQKRTVYQIPAWVPMYLGRHVRLTSSVPDGSDIHEVGAVGILDAIQWNYDDASVCLVCVFGCDLSNTTNVPLHAVEPF